MGDKQECYNVRTMQSDGSRVWCAARPLIGTMIGVGMLGLPFAVVRVGVWFGMVELVLAALVCYLVLRLYGELIVLRGGKARFIQVIDKELGHFGTGVASIAYIGATFGALLAFLLFGGQFLRTVTFGIFPMTPTESSMVFFFLASILTIGGSLFIARVQRVLIPIFLFCICCLVVVAAPNATAAHFALPASVDGLGLTFGVMLFSFHGMSALPEMRDILGKKVSLLSRSIGVGTMVVTAVYAAFILAVIGVTGAQTTENAIRGLSVLGSSFALFASGIALLVTFTVYTNVASALTNTFLYDLRMRFAHAWLLTAGIPLIAFFAGAQKISSVLSITGGILGSLTGIMMLIAYERARVSAELPKNSLHISQWAIALTFVIFVSTMVSTILR